MISKSRKTKYCVRYNSNPQLVTDNHKSEVIFLLDTDERNFDTITDAIQFWSECTSPITSLEELVPELEGMKKGKNLEWILPERNIPPKHMLIADMESIFSNQRWLTVTNLLEKDAR